MRRFNIYLSLGALLAVMLLQLPARAQFAGGNGRGEVATTLNGVDLKTVNTISTAMYRGGSGKGDALASSQNNIPMGKYFVGTTADFSQGSNWSDGAFPSSEIAIVNSLASNQPVLSGSQTIASGTTINILSGASLTIAPTGVLTVNGTLNNSGTLTLQSNATGSASIGNSSGTITGNAIVERFVPAVARRYRMYAAPVNGYNFSQLIDDIFITGPSGGVGFDVTTHSNNPSVFTYQESTTGGRGWKSFTNINTPLAVGQGALVFVRGDRTLPSPQWFTAPFVAQNAVTIDATGTLHQGDLTVNLTYTPTADTARDGFNLVGNPYASAINWATVTKNNVSNFCWIINPATHAYEAFTAGNIASGQGFFVRAIGANPFITFKETDKITTVTNGYFKTNTTPMEIKLVVDSITSDKLVLNFDSGHDKNFNPAEDAVKMNNSVVNVYATINTINIQINSLPPIDAWQSTDSVIFSTIASSGTYPLSINNLPYSMLGKQLWLHDRFTNSHFKIPADTTFLVTLNTNIASTQNRFVLYTKTPAAVPVRWLNFDAQKMGAHAQLTWITATEQNNSKFEIERKKLDETNFKPIGEVKGAGNSLTPKHYQFLDENVFTSTEYAGYYYRIKQIDYSGAISYSKTILLQNDEPKVSFTVFPNPAQHKQISLIKSNNPTELNFKVRVTNQLGVTVAQYQSKHGEVKLDAGLLPAGVYNLQITCEEQSSQPIILKWINTNQ